MSETIDTYLKLNSVQIKYVKQREARLRFP